MGQFLTAPIDSIIRTKKRRRKILVTRMKRINDNDKTESSDMVATYELPALLVCCGKNEKENVI